MRMTGGFQISTGTGVLRYTDTTIDTAMVGPDAGAPVTVDVETATGITNPLSFVPPFGPLLFRGSLVRKTEHHQLGPQASGPLHDAVTALHELGRRYDVTGVSDHGGEPGRILVRHAGQTWYDLPHGLADEARVQLHDAARRVIDLVAAPPSR